MRAVKNAGRDVVTKTKHAADRVSNTITDGLPDRWLDGAGHAFVD